MLRIFISDSAEWRDPEKTDSDCHTWKISDFKSDSQTYGTYGGGLSQEYGAHKKVSKWKSDTFTFLRKET